MVRSRFFSRLFADRETRRRLYAEDPRKSAPPPAKSIRTKDIIWDDNASDQRRYHDAQDDPRVSAPDASIRSKSVIGSDNRKRVEDAKAPPYARIGLIYGYRSLRGRASAAGTGWMISADTMITAAHTVYNRDAYGASENGRPVRVRAWLGYNDDQSPPYGVLNGKELIIHEDYIRDETNLAVDIALIKVSPSIDNRHGWLDVRNASRPANALDLSLAGYPLDLQRRPLKLYHAKGTAISIENGVVFHDIDSYAGQSGAPLMVGNGESAFAVGVHTQGKNEAASQGLSANMGILLEGAMLDWIRRHV